MFRWRVTDEDVRIVLASGEVIEDYPDDIPYPSRLVLGWAGIRPLHVVAAENSAVLETIVITVYEADTTRWEGDFKTRNKR